VYQRGTSAMGISMQTSRHSAFFEPFLCCE